MGKVLPSGNFTLLEVPTTSFPIALAHCFARCKAGKDTERLALLNRLLCRLNNRDHLACIGEYHACRAAVRGQTLAAVS